jgi:hypothetical protein
MDHCVWCFGLPTLNAVGIEKSSLVNQVGALGSDGLVNRAKEMWLVIVSIDGASGSPATGVDAIPATLVSAESVLNDLTRLRTITPPDAPPHLGGSGVEGASRQPKLMCSRILACQLCLSSGRGRTRRVTRLRAAVSCVAATRLRAILGVCYYYR